MWSDNDTAEDLIGFRVHAELIRDVVQDNVPTLSSRTSARIESVLPLKASRTNATIAVDVGTTYLSPYPSMMLRMACAVCSNSRMRSRAFRASPAVSSAARRASALMVSASLLAAASASSAPRRRFSASAEAWARSCWFEFLDRIVSSSA